MEGKNIQAFNQCRLSMWVKLLAKQLVTLVFKKTDDNIKHVSHTPTRYYKD